MVNVIDFKKRLSFSLRAWNCFISVLTNPSWFKCVAKCRSGDSFIPIEPRFFGVEFSFESFGFDHR